MRKTSSDNHLSSIDSESFIEPIIFQDNDDEDIDKSPSIKKKPQSSFRHSRTAIMPDKKKQEVGRALMAKLPSEDQFELESKLN